MFCTLWPWSYSFTGSLLFGCFISWDWESMSYYFMESLLTHDLLCAWLRMICCVWVNFNFYFMGNWLFVDPFLYVNLFYYEPNILRFHIPGFSFLWFCSGFFRASGIVQHLSGIQTSREIWSIFWARKWPRLRPWFVPQDPWFLSFAFKTNLTNTLISV